MDRMSVALKKGARLMCSMVSTIVAVDTVFTRVSCTETWKVKVGWMLTLNCGPAPATLFTLRSPVDAKIEKAGTPSKRFTGEKPEVKVKLLATAAVAA